MQLTKYKVLFSPNAQNDGQKTRHSFLRRVYRIPENTEKQSRYLLFFSTFFLCFVRIQQKINIINDYERDENPTCYLHLPCQSSRVNTVTHTGV